LKIKNPIGVHRGGKKFKKKRVGEGGGKPFLQEQKKKKNHKKIYSLLLKGELTRGGENLVLGHLGTGE